MRLKTLMLAAAMLAVPASGWAAALTPDTGPVTAQGQLTDGDGNAGTWQVQATLKDGRFTGTGSITLQGTTFTAPLSHVSYLENGRCVWEWEEGRSHMEVAGYCDSQAFTKGRFNGFLADGPYSVTGTADGMIAAAQVPVAQATGVLPKGKLTCVWWEVHVSFEWGQANTQELRYSNMATLTLTGNTYTTAHASGSFVKKGDKITLTSGAFKGAVGTLRPDTSGEPAVYFEKEENVDARGIPIVDPNTTACTTPH